MRPKDRGLGPHLAVTACLSMARIKTLRGRSTCEQSVRLNREALAFGLTVFLALITKWPCEP